MNEIKFDEKDMRLLFFCNECWCHKPKRSGIPLCPSCFSKLRSPFDYNLKNSLELIRHNGKECWSQMIEAYNLRLVIIDTLAMFRSQRVGKNTNSYTDDYKTISDIKKIADKYNTSILVVHHVRKAEANDVMDTISGTFGITGAADTLLVLEKKGPLFKLNLTGRDLDDKVFALDRDNSRLTYKLLGNADEVQSSQIRQKTLDILKKNGETMQLKDICDLIDEQQSAVRKGLVRLIDQGLVEQKGRGQYQWKKGNLEKSSGIIND